MVIQESISAQLGGQEETEEYKNGREKKILNARLACETKIDRQTEQTIRRGMRIGKSQGSYVSIR